MKSVAIITRTKDRPITLRRTLRSIENQIYKDVQWIIVNDGGERQHVDKISDLAIKNKIDTLVIHNENSLGMETCSNIAINHSKSKYISFIDDDDTWHPDFLKKTIGFLEEPCNKTCKGVITKTSVIEEFFLKNNIVTICSYPFAPGLEYVSLFELTKRNYIANLSFVYCRDALKTIGLYREDYPVVGDWEFNIRFLRAFEIGFVPEYLANCHRRNQSNGSSYNQSNVNNIHSKYCTILRNELFRQDLNNNAIGLGFAANIANEINQLERVIRRGS